MKKLIILFLGLAVISCGGSDDDEPISRTTDPLIGVWFESPMVQNSTSFAFFSNGTYSWQKYYYYDGSESATVIDEQNGTWENQGDDFNALSQTYILLATRAGNSIYNFTFNSDFTEFTNNNPPANPEHSNKIYIRQ